MFKYLTIILCIIDLDLFFLFNPDLELLVVVLKLLSGIAFGFEIVLIIDF